MDINNVIDRDPERLGGAICFVGTRAPVRNLFDYLAGGHPLADFLEDFPRVSPDAATAVLAFAATSVENTITDQTGDRERATPPPMPMRLG